MNRPWRTLYALSRPLLFRLEAEASHDLALDALAGCQRLGLQRLLGPGPVVAAPIRLFGIDFPNRVGLSAGLDKDARVTSAMHALGFGFVEVGTVTPRPQPGNPRPRLFRIPAARALVNRFGFNSEGLEAVIARLRRRRDAAVLGINIGKNRATPLAQALDDYRLGLAAAWPLADYITVNLSSPNTPGLRGLQEDAQLEPLLAGIGRERERLTRRHARSVPVLIKVAPDLDDAQIRGLAERLLDAHVDGVIATNTTLARDGVEARWQQEAGGLSGAPLTDRARYVVTAFAESLRGQLPVIGVGGIMTGRDARAMHAAGADLVQLYTGLIYRGPALVQECIAALREARPGPSG